MKLSRKILPGQPGTKKWVEEYGERLVCVRYKYDKTQKRKIKTIELVVEDSPWEVDHRRIPKNKIVDIRIEYGEITLGRLVREAGGHWNRQKKLWELPYQEVRNLGLTNRIIQHSDKNV